MVFRAPQKYTFGTVEGHRLTAHISCVVYTRWVSALPARRLLPIYALTHANCVKSRMQQYMGALYAHTILLCGMHIFRLFTKSFQDA